VPPLVTRTRHAVKQELRPPEAARAEHHGLQLGGGRQGHQLDVKSEVLACGPGEGGAGLCWAQGSGGWPRLVWGRQLQPLSHACEPFPSARVLPSPPPGAPASSGLRSIVTPLAASTSATIADIPLLSCTRSPFFSPGGARSGLGTGGFGRGAGGLGGARARTSGADGKGQAAAAVAAAADRQIGSTIKAIAHPGHRLTSGHGDHGLLLALAVALRRRQPHLGTGTGVAAR
jgi:hypothetical protein